LEDLNEYNSVANQTFLGEKDFYEFTTIMQNIKGLA
jgi:hypothetical protein